MAVTLTESAAKRVAEKLQETGGIGLRLDVKDAGCSGFAYVVDYASSISKQDYVFDSYGVSVVVSGNALSSVDGTQIDYVGDDISAAFVFRNPNVTGECGCGESFSV